MSAVADGVGCGLCAPAARGRGRESGEQRSGEGRGQQREHRVVKLSIADGTALRCGRVGSRHFRESPSGLSFFVSATLL